MCGIKCDTHTWRNNGCKMKTMAEGRKQNTMYKNARVNVENMENVNEELQNIVVEWNLKDKAVIIQLMNQFQYVQYL
jgi:hypothetical protein